MQAQGSRHALEAKQVEVRNLVQKNNIWVPNYLTKRKSQNNIRNVRMSPEENSGMKL